jgi:DNA-binding beta-propeller fold protein YncE
MRKSFAACVVVCLLAAVATAGQDPWKPYSPPCMERESVFAFTQKPTVKLVAKDKYEITFAVKGNCDVTVGIVDEKDVVLRHLASGVLGPNAPEPFKKNSLKQTIYWTGKDDLDRYPREPEKLKVRVMVGLKPTFDKRLGGTSPKNLPGKVWGIVIDKNGAYLFIKGWHLTLRKFDRDGNYVGTLFPPPAKAPMENYPGTGYIEYEPGKRAWHGLNIHDSVAVNSMVFPTPVDYKSTFDCQVALAGKKMFFLNGGSSIDSNIAPSTIYSINTDGTTDLKGQKGRPFAWGAHRSPRLAASPDGKWVYMVCSGGGKYYFDPVVVRGPADANAKATIFVGERRKPGSDNAHLNMPMGIDCDAQGRVYVADKNNSRIQIFSPDAKHLKTIRVDRPELVRVHQKTGAIYVQHMSRVKGKTYSRLTKFSSFDKPQEEFHVDNLASVAMAVDSWSSKPRLWLGGTVGYHHGRPTHGRAMRIYEEDGKTLKKIADFDMDARKEAGENYIGRWSGDYWNKVVCDPVREQIYYRKTVIFDLKTGKLLGRLKYSGATDDIAFDKRGYMHAHFNPTFYMQGVGRFDPGQASKTEDRGRTVFTYPECPYDYGIERKNLLGILPVKDQGGAKGFQDGLGVTMHGDVAAETNIYHVPRMEEVGWNFAAQAILASRKRGEYVDGSRGREYNNFAAYSKMIQNKEKHGEEVYFIRRTPGVSLVGGTIWTFNRSGEPRDACAGTVGQLIAGVQMDEDGCLYFTNNRMRAHGNKQFLAGRGGTIGSPKSKSSPFISTLMKTGPKTKILAAKSIIQMEPLPDRPADLLGHGIFPLGPEGTGGTKCWVEDVKWLYAGAGSVVGAVCSCPSSRIRLDWYKRVYTPEAYRHSLAALDTNGNLIMHIGRYGNFDDAPGGRNGCRPGGEDFGITYVRFVSSTDNYLVFSDWGERLVVLKLDYHADETVPIKLQ